MDFSIFGELGKGIAIVAAVSTGLILSKFGSGHIAGRIARFSPKDSAIFGTASVIQLTTTLAVVYVASGLNLLDSALVSAIIFLSILATFLGPIILGVLLKDYD